MEQKDRVLLYMHDNNGITRTEGLTELGVSNVPAVINVLRNEGAKIVNLDMAGINRYGEKCTWVRYLLEDII